MSFAFTIPLWVLILSGIGVVCVGGLLGLLFLACLFNK